jgi:cytochrome P450 family 135
MVDISPIVLVGSVIPELQRFGPWKRFRANQNQIDALLYAEIVQRRQAPDLAKRTDVLSRLLQIGIESGDAPLTDAELRDQLVTLLLAGHETTAAALSWTLYELASHPAPQRRAYAAVIEATLKESMRLHPMIASTARKSVAGSYLRAPSSTPRSCSHTNAPTATPTPGPTVPTDS